MKKLIRISSIIFAILTVAGAIYVIATNGEVNAGYAAVPMVFTMVCSSEYRRLNNKEKGDNIKIIKNKWRKNDSRIYNIFKSTY